MRKIVKDIVSKLGIEIKRRNPKDFESKVVSLKTKNGSSKGNVLLSYVIEPFLLKAGEPVSNAHTHDWESLQIARTFLDLGYSVDVIDYRNGDFIPEKNYAIFIAARTNFERIARLLNEDCVKIVHLDTAHWLFNNQASYSRSLALQRRRGVTVTPVSQRIVAPNLAIEYADYATMLGNQFTFNTYSYAQKPIYRVSIPTCVLYPWPEDKDFESCRKNFLWFGSGGLVHKGLDLLLEIFVGMPEYHLTICGPIEKEEGFINAYSKELYQTPNIHTIGWVNVESSGFIGITKNCIGLIYPSCSEGQCGAVVTCLQAGLIPIVSSESGVDMGDFGVILKDCSTDEIKNTIQNVSNLPPEELKQMARKAWEFARANHTRERFAEEFKNAILSIMNIHGDNKNPADRLQTSHNTHKT